MEENTDLPAILPPVRLETSPEKASVYAELTADLNPIHLDAEFAARTPFGKPIAHGTMSLGLLLLAIEKGLGDRWSAREVNIRFSRPVPVGETIIAGGELSGDEPGTYKVYVETEGGVRALEGICKVARI